MVSSNRATHLTSAPPAPELVVRLLCSSSTLPTNKKKPSARSAWSRPKGGTVCWCPEISWTLPPAKLQWTGMISTLVNNMSRQTSCDDITHDAVERHFRLNILHMFAMTKFAVPHIERGGSHHQYHFHSGRPGKRDGGGLRGDPRRRRVLYQVAGIAAHAQGHSRKRRRASALVPHEQPGRRWRAPAQTCRLGQL